MKTNTSLVAENTLGILRLFTEYEGLTINEIAKLSSLNISTVYRIVNTLKNEKYLNVNSENKYTLNRETILQFYKMVNQDVKEFVKPVLIELAFELQESVYLSQLYEEKKVMIIEKEDGPGKLQWIENIGYLYDIPVGTAGKAHLAYLLKNSSSKEKISLINQLTLKRYTENSITNKAQLLENIKKILIEGYSMTDSEHVDGMIGFSVPILTSKSSYTGYILTLIIPKVRYNQSQKYDYIAKIREAADKIGNKLIK